jgi:uncharacterized protein YcgL (UPF0745 family)
MLTAIYKSPRKEQTYLYLKQRDDFKVVPEALLKTFGSPQLVTVLDLSRRTELAGADLAKVKDALSEQGYYLQLPPPPEDLLQDHRDWLANNQPQE